MRGFLDRHGRDMEFCQIQLNYLDWTLQNAKEKYELLKERGIPIWVMEPVRGGRLAKLEPEQEAQLKAVRPEDTAAKWCFRFLQSLDNIQVVLSGMSSVDQMRENIRSFEQPDPLSKEETELLFRLAEEMKNSVPCTGCGYCRAGCPMGLDIPMLMAAYNEVRYSPITGVAMRFEFLPEDQKASACIACGNCAKVCPQKIDIPQMMRNFTETMKTIPTWAEICRERSAASKR